VTGLTLGVESTSHTLSIGVVDSSGEVRCLETSRFETTRPGMYPREAADYQSEHCQSLLARVCSQIDPHRIVQIGFSRGPGIAPCLQIGATVARTLARVLQVPLIAVNHCEAHIEIGQLFTNQPTLIALYVSGGNTQIVKVDFDGVRNWYEILGETLDIGVGNLLDRIGRHLGMGFYAGPILEQLAAQSDQIVPLPFVVRGTSFEFSGLLTAVKQLHDQRAVDGPVLASSVQEHVFGALGEAVNRILAQHRRDLLLVGGVACNTRLRTILQAVCDAQGVRLIVPPRRLCVDNGAMIAWSAVRNAPWSVCSIDHSSVLQIYEYHNLR